MAYFTNTLPILDLLEMDTVFELKSGISARELFLGTTTLPYSTAFRVSDGLPKMGIDFVNSKTAPIEAEGPVFADLTGTAGDDVINGTASSDTINALAGNDTIIYGQSSTSSSNVDVIDGGSGIDTYEITNLTTVSSGWEVNLTTGLFEWIDGSGVRATRGTLTNIENVTVSGEIDVIGDGNDNVLTATSATHSNTLSGMGGDDALDGGGGDDVLNGGNGNDILIFGQGVDVLNGDDGNDTFLTSTLSLGNVIDGGVGTDTLEFSSYGGSYTVDLSSGSFTTSGGAEVASLTSVENVIAGAGNDTLIGTNGNSDIRGGDGDDIIVGRLGDNSLYGDAGDDSFVFDTVYGSQYFGTANGGVGTDRLLLRGNGIIDLDDDDMDFLNIDVIEFDVDGNGAARTVFLGEQEFDDVNEISSTVQIDGRGNGFADHILIDSGNSSASQSVDISGWTFIEWDDSEDTITISGTLGNDTLIGSSQADTLNGGGGNDTLDGGDGDDTLNGGAGEDRLIASAGELAGDVYDGGTGGDIFDLSAVNFGLNPWVINLTTGEFTYVTGGSDIATLIGIENVDGSSVADIITGDGNSNVLNGGAGDDELYTGTGGVDTLNGGDDDDVLHINDTNTVGDSYDGGAGVDTLNFSSISAGATPWIMNLNTGEFTSVGSGLAAATITGIENVVGTAGDDIITGNGSDNVLNGGAGDDVLDGIGGVNELNGGDGDDRLMANSSPIIGNVYDGGAGVDTFDLANIGAGFNPWTVNLATGEFSYVGGGASVASLVNIENIEGSVGHDILTGDGGDNVLNGNGGDDVLDGGMGTNQLDGGAGDDRLIASTHVILGDTYDGGAGTDVFDLSAVGFGANPWVTNLTSGEFTYVTGGSAIATLTSIENVDGSSVADIITGNASDNVLNGGAGDDELYTGTGGADTLNGGDDDDVLHISDSNTVGDSYDGGAGVDTLNFSSISAGATPWIMNLNTGEFTSVGSGVAAATIIGIENVVGTAGDDIITGNGSDNVLNGGAGDDVLDGISGANQLNGGAGDDRLVASITPINGSAYDGGAGLDTFDLANVGSGANPWTVNLATGEFSYVTGGASVASLAGIENVEGSTGADILTGDGGDNVLNGNGGDDIINGGAGNDIIHSGLGTDSVDAGAGDDTVIWDYILGDAEVGESYEAGSGTDTFTTLNYTLSAGDVIDLEAGTFVEGILVATITNFENYDGTGNLGATGVAAEIVRGTSGVNIISTGDGDHRIEGRAGDDTINGGAGNDSIEGGAGADVLDGGADTDTVDYASSLAGVTVNLLTNVNVGGDAQGDDLSNFENIFGSLNNDILTGDAGANFISATDGNDRLDGGDGDDVLFGDNGADTILGGAGADLNDGGLGFDAMDYRAASSRVVFDLGTGGTLGDALGDSYVSIERAYGSDFNDAITGTAANEFFYGEDGNDTINGGGGIDRIYGGDGNDIQRGQDGNDTLYGSAGSDQLNGGTGFDVANYSNASSFVSLNMASGGTFGDAAGDTYFGIEAVYGSDFNDILIGNTSSNELRGGDGDDIVNGGAGNDRLYGGDGADAFNGGTGIDAVFYTTATTGVSLDLATGGISGEADGDTFSSVEWVRGSDHSDEITGNSSANSLFGNDGGDILSGAGGNDRLYGGDGDDIVNGGDGIDFIYGQGGDDMLFGEAGNDFFYGSDGGDVYDGGADFDTVSYVPSSSGVDINLQAGGTGGDADGDSYTSIERVFGSTHDDVIIGSDNDDTILGNGGADIIGGGQGNDRLFGGAGDDAFIYDTTNGDADLIYNFRAGTLGDELIYIEGGDTDFDTFAEVMAVATQVGNNVVFDFGGGNTMTFINLLITRFEAIDFDFGGTLIAETPSTPKIVEAELPVSSDDALVAELDDMAIAQDATVFVSNDASYDVGTDIETSDFYI